jgi:hypothetical protein
MLERRSPENSQRFNAAIDNRKRVPSGTREPRSIRGGASDAPFVPAGLDFVWVVKRQR